MIVPKKKQKIVTLAPLKKLAVRRNGVVVKNPTSSSCWKSFERKVAEYFGGKRTPLSGMNSSHTSSDVIHDELYIECKLRNSFSLWTLFEDTKKKAKIESKIPVVSIKEKGKEGFLILIDPNDIHYIAKILTEIKK